MRICNNKDGLPDCCGDCYDNGLCTSQCKCEDSLAVNEQLVKILMTESGRHKAMMDNFREKAKFLRELGF